MPNKRLLNSFIDYCHKHQDERFWQALKNWSGAKFIVMAHNFNMDTNEWEGDRVTFFFEEKNK